MLIKNGRLGGGGVYRYGNKYQAQKMQDYYQRDQELQNEGQQKENYEIDYQDVGNEKGKNYLCYQDGDQGKRKEYDEVKEHEIEKQKVKYQKHHHEEAEDERRKDEEPEVNGYKGLLGSGTSNNTVMQKKGTLRKHDWGLQQQAVAKSDGRNGKKAHNTGENPAEKAYNHWHWNPQ